MIWIFFQAMAEILLSAAINLLRSKKMATAFSLLLFAGCFFLIAIYFM
jgi:hypothetical protein